jgi:hypothetical protein
MTSQDKLASVRDLVIHTVHPGIIKSLIFVSSLINDLRLEIETAATNHISEVASGLSYDFKKMLKSPQEGPHESIVPTGTPNHPQMFLCCPRKGAEVPDLNARVM